MSPPESIRQYITHDLLNDSALTITDSQDLLTTGVLDSINVMRLVAHLETEFGVTIPPEDVVLENFGSLEMIVNYLQSRSASA